jgi:hypothetical protein
MQYLISLPLPLLKKVEQNSTFKKSGAKFYFLKKWSKIPLFKKVEQNSTF